MDFSDLGSGNAAVSSLLVLTWSPDSVKVVLISSANEKIIRNWYSVLSGADVKLEARG